MNNKIWKAKWIEYNPVFYIQPNIFAKWKNNSFEVNFNATYEAERLFRTENSVKQNNRGEFDLDFAWKNDYITTKMNLGIVVGNLIGENAILVPFAAEVNANLPVYFSNRKLFFAMKGGLESNNDSIYELEKLYNFTAISKMPSETTDWFGNLNISIPIKNTFTANVALDFKKTAKLVGYSDETIEYTDDSIIVSYEKFDKKLNEFELHFVGANGIEKDVLSKHKNIMFHEISAVKLERKLTLKNLLIPFKLCKAIKDARAVLQKIAPDIVFSKGGFVSVPVVMAAKAHRVPIVIHESDMTPGLANKMCFSRAWKICCSRPVCPVCGSCSLPLIYRRRASIFRMIRRTALRFTFLFFARASQRLTRLQP